MDNPYQIDIDPTSQHFSPPFKDFFYHHFVNPTGLIHNDVDTSFFTTMPDGEKEIAKRLIRDNLKVRHPHLFKAAGKLKDESALPILYEQFNANADYSWHLTIGQAIWRINGDNMYVELLRKLPAHRDPNMKAAHLRQVTDLKNEESIDLLFSFLNDKDKYVRLFTLSILNYLLLGTNTLEKECERKYFQARKDDPDFKKQLLPNLQNLP
jgi:hypothetical protein